MATMRIKTKIDNSEVDSGLKQLQNKLDESARNLSTATKELERQESILEKEKETLKEQNRQYDEIYKKRRQTESKLNAFKESTNVGFGGDRYDIAKAESMQNAINTYDSQLASIDAMMGRTRDNIEKQKVAIAKSSDKVESYKNKWSEAKTKVQETTQKVEEQERKDLLKKISTNVKNAGKGMENLVKKTGRWALALLGIRTVLNFLRSAMSSLSSEDEQLSANLEYIKWVLVQNLKPVVEWLINAMYTVLGIINTITKAWFGYDLFAGKGADDFASMKKSSEGVASNMEEAKKQLAGFDEMNVMQDNSSSGGGGGAGGGAVMPNIDIGGEVPEWLQWIVDHKDEILAIIGGVATGLGLWKLGLDPIMALGIGIAVAGLILAIEGLIGYLNDPTWENFGKTLEGIALIVIGLGVVFASIPAIVIGAVLLIYAIIIKYWDEIKAFLQKGIDWLTDQSDLVHKVFGDTIGDIYDAFVGVLSNMLKGWDNTFKAIKRIFDDVIDIVKKIIKGDWKGAWESAKDIVVTIFDTIKKNIKLAFDSIWGVIKTVATKVGEILWGGVKGAINGIIGQVESTINAPIRAINKLIGVINKVPGVDLSKLSTFSLPRMATGGILNLPGKGVAIGGEAGREGVLPLTNPAVMRELGEEIGKNVVMNLTNVTKLDSKIISRETKRVDMRDSFLLNR